MSIQVNSKIQSSPCGPRIVEQNTTEIRTLALALGEIPADAFASIRGSIVASIPACHAGDPGSIPGRGDSCLSKFPCASQAQANAYTSSKHFFVAGANSCWNANLAGCGAAGT